MKRAGRPMSMWTLTQENVVQYLSERAELQGLAWNDSSGTVEVSSLGGGVSNIVLRICTPRLDMVVKQALPKLNVAEEWLASVDRLEREVACLRFLQEHLPEGAVPRFLFYDAQHYIYGMTTVPDTFAMWKSRLLEGEVDPGAAGRIGRLLGEIHRLTWGRERIGDAFDDLDPFYQLRLDPYYGATMRRHPEMAAHFEQAVKMATESRFALVHGDFSPKNILVDRDRVVLLDYEVAHFGDPAFDTAFLINHLLLKAVHLPRLKKELAQAAGEFWREYQAALFRGEQDGLRPGELELAELERRTLVHLGCLHLARVDGKSPAEYLTSDTEKDAVRTQAKWILNQGVSDLARLLERVSSDEPI